MTVLYVLFNYMYLILHLFSYGVCLHTHILQLCGGQKSIHKNHFSASIMWVRGIELHFSALVLSLPMSQLSSRLKAFIIVILFCFFVVVCGGACMIVKIRGQFVVVGLYPLRHLPVLHLYIIYHKIKILVTES